MVVRTRFAPSPTGVLHVGGVRTALFSWLYAKHHAGKCILRIEDTDTSRSTQASVQAILESMHWLGLTYDEGPYYQTDRYPRYMAIAEQLLASGNAYRCDCSKARLDHLRESQLSRKEKPRYDGHCRKRQAEIGNQPYVIRFKTPPSGTLQFIDQVYGKIEIDNEELDDLVLMRSDQHPTYNFAVVVDDLDMGITHVIRGDDHINNTPRQIHIFHALEAPPPLYAHLPMILGEDGKPLSKRHGAVSVLDFKTEGFLPQALLNYLVRLGWSHGDQEIFSLDEMISDFDLTKVSRSASIFNYDKLQWLDHHYLKSSPKATLEEALRDQFIAHHMDEKAGPPLSALIQAQIDRCKTLKDMAEKSRYFYQDSIDYDQPTFETHCRQDILDPLTALRDRLETLDLWEQEPLHQCIHAISEQFHLNFGKLAQPLRVAVTGGTTSPSIDLTLMLLGKKKTLARLNQALQNMLSRQ